MLPNVKLASSTGILTRRFLFYGRLFLNGDLTFKEPSHKAVYISAHDDRNLFFNKKLINQVIKR